MGAIGMNEIMSIPTGILACDAMLKAAEVELVSAGCVCAGKYYIVVQGEVAAVRSAVEAGDAEAAQVAANKAGRLLDKAASKGIIHKNQAAQRKSGVQKLVNTIK